MGVLLSILLVSAPGDGLAMIAKEFHLRNSWCKSPVEVPKGLSTEEEILFRLKVYSKNPSACFSHKMDPDLL